MPRIRKPYVSPSRIAERKAARLARKQAERERKALIRQVEKPFRQERLTVAGMRVDPEPIEDRLRKVKWVKDLAVTARGSGDDRRLVAFVVVEPGRLLRDIEEELQAVASRMKAYQRPKAFTAVEFLPRDPVRGKLDRRRLASGAFDGRTFQIRAGRYCGKQGISKVIRNPINEVRFEGIVARAPEFETGRTCAPQFRVRKGETRVSLSHTLPNSSRRVTVSFIFVGAMSRAARKLEVGARVVISARIITEWSGRQFLATDIQHVEPEVDRASADPIDQVIEALM